MLSSIRLSVLLSRKDNELGNERILYGIVWVSWSNAVAISVSYVRQNGVEYHSRVNEIQLEKPKQNLIFTCI